MRIGNHVAEILTLECPEHSEEEGALGQAVRELFLARQVLNQYGILQRVREHVLHRQLGVARHLEVDDLVGLQVLLLLPEDVAEERQ